MPGTRKLGRPTAHRMSMLRGLTTYLLENGSVETTLTRAKEVRSLAEKMITLGKRTNFLCSGESSLNRTVLKQICRKTTEHAHSVRRRSAEFSGSGHFHCLLLLFLLLIWDWIPLRIGEYDITPRPSSDQGRASAASGSLPPATSYRGYGP